MSLTRIWHAPSWGGAAHHMMWNDTEVIAVLHPTVPADEAQALGKALVGATRPGCWPLLAIEPYEQGSAWIYPLHSGCSLVPVVLGPLLPLRAAVELIADVAACLERFDEVHPGPRPEDVLIAPEGQLHIVGWVAPGGPDPARVAPGTGGHESLREYRLGVLAAELLGGASPIAQTGAESHTAVVRRTLIRVLSRPGPMLPDALRTWLESTLSFDPALRPPLREVAPLLRSIAEDLPLPTLSTWCAEDLRSAIQLFQADPSPHATLPLANALRRDPLTSRQPFSGADLPVEDDVTALSEGSTPGIHSRIELGAMPISVGPPAEVARLRPTLPAEIFSQEADPPMSLPPRNSLADRRLKVAAVGLSIAAIALLVYLFSF